jgi:lysophospholipase L1-like esterase
MMVVIQVNQGTQKMKLLIRGGSIAAGHGVARGYADILRDHYASRGLQVINRSGFGKTSFEGVDTFYQDFEPCRPEYLILHFGMDDAFAAVYRSEFKENLVHMIRMAQKSLQPVILLPTSHALDDEHDMESVAIFHRVIREVSEDLHCRMVPVHTFWAGYISEKGMKNADLLQEDVRYPNGKGHEVYAEALMRSLDRILCKDD